MRLELEQMDQGNTSFRAVRIGTEVARPAPVEIFVNGRSVAAYANESLAAALMANGVVSFRRTGSGKQRGPYCNMGSCFECVVTVEEVGPVRACLTPVTAGMKVTVDAD